MNDQLHCCDNCGAPNGFLVWEGYNTPLPDVAPTHHEWQALFLCPECADDPEVQKHFRIGEFRKGGEATAS